MAINQVNQALGFNPLQQPAKVNAASGQSVGDIGNILRSIFNDTGTVQLGNIFKGNSGGASVLGANTGQSGMGDEVTGPIYTPYEPIPTASFVDPASLGGGGGGGVSSSQVAQQRKIIQDRKNALTGNANSLYNDTVTDLDKVGSLLGTQNASAKGFIQGDEATNLSTIDRQSGLAQRQARQQFQDLQLEARRRARATGGGSSSGFADLTNRLDQELVRNIGDINQSAMDNTTKVKTVAMKALSDLQANYDRSIAEIESDKRKSAREKNMAIQEAELAAADAATKVDAWAQSKISSSRGGSIAQTNAANKSQIAAQYAQAIANAQNQAYGADVGKAIKQINAAFSPALAQTGAINPTGVIDFINGKKKEPTFADTTATLKAGFDAGEIDYENFQDQFNKQFNTFYPN